MKICAGVLATDPFFARVTNIWLPHALALRTVASVGHSWQISLASPTSASGSISRRCYHDALKQPLVYTRYCSEAGARFDGMLPHSRRSLCLVYDRFEAANSNI
jgi:hypothetical protein